jgi:hypothetical protein
LAFSEQCELRAFPRALAGIRRSIIERQSQSFV